MSTYCSNGSDGQASSNKVSNWSAINHQRYKEGERQRGGEDLNLTERVHKVKVHHMGVGNVTVKPLLSIFWRLPPLLLRERFDAQVQTT